jgi:Mce-associated membrane protein
MSEDAAVTEEAPPETPERPGTVDGDEALEAVEAAEAVEVADSPESPARPSRQVLALAAAVIAALAVAGVLGWNLWQQRQLNQARADAQRTAVSYAEILTSIDSNKVDENFRQVLDGATGEFKDMYTQSSVELRQLLIENKATAHGVVVDSAVQSITKDKAVVLLFVDQSVSNTKLPDPRVDRSRMKMTLEKIDGTWRAAKVELP